MSSPLRIFLLLSAVIAAASSFPFNFYSGGKYKGTTFSKPLGEDSRLDKFKNKRTGFEKKSFNAEPEEEEYEGIEENDDDEEEEYGPRFYGQYGPSAPSNKNRGNRFNNNKNAPAQPRMPSMPNNAMNSNEYGNQQRGFTFDQSQSGPMGREGFSRGSEQGSKQRRFGQRMNQHQSKEGKRSRSNKQSGFGYADKKSKTGGGYPYQKKAYV